MFKILFLSLLLVSCRPIKFEKDTEFMTSAIANSPEYLIKLNGKICKDTDDMIGLCAKRLRTTEDLKITVLPQQYTYTFRLDCTDYIQSDISFSVPANMGGEYVLSASKFKDYDVFNCTIDIIPQDRLNVSAFAAFRIYVVDAEYITLDSIVRNKEFLILGRHSYFSNVCGEDKKETTMLKTNCDKAIVESYNMRFNYANITD